MYLIEILHQTTTLACVLVRKQPLYLIEILHQTTTTEVEELAKTALYLIEILHQTTTVELGKRSPRCCILSKFYIKPQQRVRHKIGHSVVSYRNSTSNHNLSATSDSCGSVVSYRNSTSNHNIKFSFFWLFLLYLIEILHQTTTVFGLRYEMLQLYLIEILHQTTTGPRVRC